MSGSYDSTHFHSPNPLYNPDTPVLFSGQLSLNSESYEEDVEDVPALPASNLTPPSQVAPYDPIHSPGEHTRLNPKV